MKIANVSELNNNFNCYEDFLAADEAYYAEIREVADKIEESAEKRPIVLLSGPSGSGKTTTASILEKTLDAKGLETHLVSLDDYFTTVHPDDIEKTDYESPDRVDGKLLTEHIRQIIACEETEIPKFDFEKSARRGISQTIKRKSGEVVIFEGIHALNPNTIALGDEATMKIYVSVRTRISNGKEVFHPKYLRLLRRIARDKLFRGRDIADTVKYFKSVEEGEIKYIIPYKHRADINIDSFNPYELGVYKTLFYDLLKEEKGEEIDVLLRLLESVDGKSPEYVPENSTIREFIDSKVF